MIMKKTLLIMCLATLSLTAWAQEEKDELQGEVSTSLSSLRLANELVKYGYAQQEALPLIQALQIMKQTPTQNLNAEKEGETVDLSQTDQKKGLVNLDYDKILADAKVLADGDNVLTELLAQVENAEVELSRGAVNGPKYTVEAVNGNSSDYYNISFVANYLAEIALCGDGDTDLDLYVYDSNGNLIASDTDYTDECYVCWVPKWTGRFRVKIVNRGPIYNRYVLITN